MTKNIFITGGGGKIGGQMVSAFLLNGWSVIITTRNKKNIRSRLKNRFDISDNQLKLLSVIEIDFSDEKAEEKILKFFQENESLMPHVLVNNARSLENLVVEEDGKSSILSISNEYLFNVIIPYRLSMQLVELSSNLYSIINISSIYGIVPFNPNLYSDYLKSAPIQYSLSKAAVIHLSKELAIRFRNKKVRVNTVSYGGVEGRVDDEFKLRYQELCPEGGMLKEEQVVGPILFLSSEESQGITGQNIIQDGGWTIW